MSETHLTEKQIELYLARHALSPVELLGIDDHLVQCAPCRARVTGKNALPPLARALREYLTGDPKSETAASSRRANETNEGESASHLSYEQMVALVDDALDRETQSALTAHVEACRSCHAELDDLHAFRRTFASESEAEAFAAASIASQPKPASQTKAAPTLRERFAHLFAAPAATLTRGRVFNFATAGAFALTLFIFGVVLFIALRMNAPSPEVANANTREAPRPTEQRSNDSTAATSNTSLNLPTDNLNTERQNATERQDIDASVKQQSQTQQQQSTPRRTQNPVETPRGATRTDDTIIESQAMIADAGASLALDRQNNLRGAEVFTSAERETMRRALLTGRVRVSPEAVALASTRRRETLLGADNEREALTVGAPVGVVVETARPVFRWQTSKAWRSYTVNIYDQNFNRVQTSGEIAASTQAATSGLSVSGEQATQMSWQPNEPLARGAIYSWQIRATREDGSEQVAPAPPAPQAKFKVLSQAELSGIEAARRRNSALLLGTRYAEAGMLDEAEREFQRLLSANPRSSIARRLLQSVEQAKRAGK